MHLLQRLIGNPTFDPPPILRVSTNDQALADAHQRIAMLQARARMFEQLNVDGDQSEPGR